MDWMKPYTFKRVGYIWFMFIYEIRFDGDAIHKTSDKEEAEYITQYCNAAYNLGYQQRKLDELLESKKEIK